MNVNVIETKVNSTLVADGVDIPDGSPEAVALYEKILRDAYDDLQAAALVLARCPETVQDEWEKRHARAERAARNAVGPVARFAADYRERGLDSALADARFRKELQ